MSKYWRIEDGQVCLRTPNAELRGFDYTMLVDCLNERDKKIADLEKELQEWQDGTIIAQWQDYEQRVKELERQLAEKENEIEELRFKERNIFPLVKNLEQKVDQDKTDFAIEQLEKVKKFVIRQLFIITKDCSDLDEAEAKGCNELREEIIKEINNQIKELRG